MKLFVRFYFLLCSVCFFFQSVIAKNHDENPSGAPGDVNIELSYTKGSANFAYSIAYVIWIENESQNYIQNLFVCNTVLGIGKTLTGTALPYWKMNKYPNSEVDGVTGATQKNTDFTVSGMLSNNAIRQFKIFMEVDHSFDSNDWFWDQPALLYSADVDLDNLQSSYTLQAVGWTRNDNLSGSTSNKFKDDPPHTSPTIGELQSELRYIKNEMDGTGFGDEYADNTAATNIVGSLIATITIDTDNIAPTVPGNLGGTAISSSAIQLTWTASTDNVGVAGYNIFRDNVPIATCTSNSYNDTALTANTAYLYEVSAFDAANNTSELSADTLIITLSAPLSSSVVSIQTPTSLITDEVFDVYITLLNNGTHTWGEGSGEEYVTLVSKYPDFNSVWGTYFIIKGQGHPVAPGESFTFTAPLRAPHEPGEYNMSWQCQNWIPLGGHVPDLTTIPFFGEIATTSITVAQRQEVQPPAPTPNPGVISISDFEYVGSFKLPGMSGFEDTYNESGLTLRKIDGETHMIVGTGTYATDMYEFEIPQPEPIIDGNYNNIPVAPFFQDWGPIDFGNSNPNGERVYPNCGFWFDNENSTMYWSHYNSYYAGGPSGFPTLVSTLFNTDGSTTHLNGWYIPDGYNPFKSYWGGVLKLSDRFATQYTDGRDMAVGFGGYYSICGSASRGPALGAIARPDAAQSTMDLLPMMTYIDGISACPRDGNYFSNIYWITPPPNPWTGEWTGVDGARAGIFIDMPDKKGYIAFTKQGIGRIGYDYGGYNADGHYQDVWYFYNIEDLGTVALGEKEPTSVLPDTYSNVQFPIPGRMVSGACFDEETRMLYLYVMQSIPQQYGSKPIIHAYHLKEQSENISIYDHVFDQESNECYGANENIVVAGNGKSVDFQSGSSVNLIAGNSIQLLPGTHIQQGAYFQASITTDRSFCEQIQQTLISTIPIAPKSKNYYKSDSAKTFIEQSIKVFPNPNNGKFTVKVEGINQTEQIVIYNSLGALIYYGTINYENNIDLSNVNRGLYFICITGNNKLLHQKFLIE